jgi:CheY-like chemotaxis protein
VVDDEADIAYLFRDALRTIEGVDVFAFTDPTLALEHFQINHSNYRCIITDFRMPSTNGAELLDKIKEINPDVKRILLSAFEMYDDLFKDCHSIDQFFSKPIIVSELIEVVQQYVKKVEINSC